MKKEYVIGILFFSSLWGCSEAFLGEVLYSVNMPFASVPLTVIGFFILAFAHVFFPQIGIAILIASMAMLYKFLNVPFFACHLLGILLMGICFDLFFNVFKIKNRLISILGMVYLNYTLFAVMITYIFRYENWIKGGLIKVLSHIFISGSITALACVFLLPIGLSLGKKIKSSNTRPFNLNLHFAPGGIAVLTLGLWILSLVVYIW